MSLSLPRCSIYSIPMQFSVVGEKNILPMLCIAMEKYCMTVSPLNSGMKRERQPSDICTKTAPRILYLHLIYALFSATLQDVAGAHLPI